MTIAKRSFTICIAESASGKDEANPAFWLATKMGPFRQLGISRVGLVRKVLFLAGGGGGMFVPPPYKRL